MMRKGENRSRKKKETKELKKKKDMEYKVYQLHNTPRWHLATAVIIDGEDDWIGIPNINKRKWMQRLIPDREEVISWR